MYFHTSNLILHEKKCQEYTNILFVFFSGIDHVKKHLIMKLIWTLLSLLTTWTTLVKGWKMHNIYWNTTNPMFRIDNTDNVIDINVNNLDWEYDQANIICPRYRKGTRPADVEQYVIYNVSKEEYEDCRITQPHPRVIAICDQPHDLKYVTITFRSFTPTPGGLEFKPGKDYFFISTSSRSDLYRRLGGRCSTHNMRLVFKISTKDGKIKSEILEETIEDASRPNINVPRIDTHHEEDLLDESSKKLSDFHSYLYPMRDIIELDSNSVEQSKRSENYADEVVKQEASVMHSNGTSKVSVSGLLLSVMISLSALYKMSR